MIWWLGFLLFLNLLYAAWHAANVSDAWKCGGWKAAPGFMVCGLLLLVAQILIAGALLMLVLRTGAT